MVETDVRSCLELIMIGISIGNSDGLGRRGMEREKGVGRVL